MSGPDSGWRTAVVIVRPPGYRDHTPVTSENLNEALPSEAQVQLVQRLFAEAGFDVSQAFAGSFAIGGPATRFAEKLPPLPTSACDGWLAPADGLLHSVTPGEPVQLDGEQAGGDQLGGDQLGGDERDGEAPDL